jgi:ribose transport system substrate-binding protein
VIPAQAIVTRRCVLALMLCGSAAHLILPSTSRSETKEKGTVLFVCLTLGNPFYQEMLIGLKEEVAKDGSIILEARNGRSPTDVKGQREIIESYLARNPKRGSFHLRGVVLVPANSGPAISTVVRELNDAHVPVINVDIAVDEDALAQSRAHVDAFIGSNNVEGGRSAADVLTKYLPGGGNVLLLLGGLGESTTRDRRNGFMARLDELNEQRGYKASVTEKTASWTENVAFTETTSLLASGVTLGGIFAENDLMALGAARAVQATTLKRAPVIIGYDATPSARAAIKKGTLTASISQNPAEMGRKAIIALHTVWSGGAVKQPREFTVVTPITKDNL